MTRQPVTTRHDKGRGDRCPLTADEVYKILASQRIPITTTEVAEFCISRYAYPDISTDQVRRLLRWLERRDRIRSWANTTTNAAALTALGAPPPPPNRQRYWAVTTRDTP